MVATYIYGAPIHNSRYILLFCEGTLDALKAALVARAEISAHAYIASEPGSQKPPQFELAAAALQKHLRGPAIKVRGSSGLKLSPVVMRSSKNLLALTTGSHTVSLIPVCYLLQVWRQGSFGCYDLPNERIDLKIPRKP